MNSFIKIVEQVNDKVHSAVWGPGMLVILMFIGLYFTIGTKFFQITKLRLWMNRTIISVFKRGDSTRTTDKKAISQFQSLSTALAGTMGTGNIIGVATAIVAGGAGAVFWMWMAALFGMMIKYAENVLGIIYRRRNSRGEWEGGPMIYIERGLKLKPLAVIFSIFCVLASFGVGNMAQVNAISTSLEETLSVPKIATGIAVAIIVGVVMVGGLKRIARVSEKVIPVISIIYIIGSLSIVIVNWRGIVPAFTEIFEGAFGFRAAAGGTAGYALSTALRYGVARGVFSNEAGMGSSVIVHSTADVEHPARQGMWGIFEVFADTLVVCTITSLAIITTGVHHSADSGVLTISAFETVFGSFGGIFISASVFIFAFASLLGWSFFGWRGLAYLTNDKGERIYQFIFLAVAVLGSVVNLELAMSISDSFNGLMAIPNLIAIILLSKKVFESTKDYLNSPLSRKRD